MTTSPTSESAFELVSMSKTGKNGSVEYKDQDISLSIPSGWFSVTENIPGDGGNIIRINSINFVDAEYETSCDIKITEYPSGKDEHLKLSENTDEKIAVNQSRFSDYQERPGSREDITISGLPGFRNIIDRKHSSRVAGYRATDSDLVLYVFRAAYGNKTFTAYFRSAKEDFDRFRPVFDSIVESVQLK